MFITRILRKLFKAKPGIKVHPLRAAEKHRVLPFGGKLVRHLHNEPPKLGIRSFVNGEKRQDSNTDLQIFDIDHVIHELTQGMTLKAGTIIATGTPAGVGMGMDPPQFLKPGDTVRCEIDGIGSLTNTVR